MDNPSIVVLPQPAAAAPSGPAAMLVLGRELVALVASIADDGTLFLKVGNSLIAARSDQQLKPGDVLRLQVSEVGPDQVVLKLLPSEQSPSPAQAGPPGELKTPVSFELPLAELQPLADELELQARAQAPTPAAAHARTPLPGTPAQSQIPGQLPDASEPSGSPTPAAAQTRTPLPSSPAQPQTPGQPPADTAPVQADTPAAIQARTPPPASPAQPQTPGQRPSGSAPAGSPNTAERDVPQLDPDGGSVDGDEPGGSNRQTPGTPAAPAAETSARTQTTASAGGRAAALPAALGQGVVQGRVVADEQGSLLLRLPAGGRLQLPEQLQRALTPGQTLEVAVEQPLPGASTTTVELRPLPPPPTDQRAALVRQLTAQLAPQVGEKTAAGIAEFVAARGVPAGDAPLLAAKLLAQQLSPVELLRQLAVAHPKAGALLQSIEEDLVSGDPDRVRSALSRLGLDQEKQLAQGELTEASTLKSMAGPEGETAVSAQQMLLLKPGSDPMAPVFLFLPLPDGGQARLVVDESPRQERPDGHYSVRGELDLERTGTVSFHLLAGEQAAFLVITSPDGAVVDHLRADMQPLVRALERALGVSVSATLKKSAKEAPSLIAVNFEKTDLYA